MKLIIILAFTCVNTFDNWYINTSGLFMFRILKYFIQNISKAGQAHTKCISSSTAFLLINTALERTTAISDIFEKQPQKKIKFCVVPYPNANSIIHKVIQNIVIIHN